MRNFLIIGLCLGLIGCAHGADQIKKPFSEPQYGMTKIQMFDLLGKPERIEIYKKTDLSRVEYYFYTRSAGSAQEDVPVCLINNRIAGWGRSYYEDHVSQDDIRIR